MAFLMKITYSPAGDFESFLLHGPDVGEEVTWGEIDRDGNGFRSNGDVKYWREGNITVGDRGLILERQGANRRFAALVEVVSTGDTGVDRWVPVYRVLERFDGARTLAQLRKSDPKIDAMWQFRKNYPGTMLRSFLDLETPSMERLLKALRAR